MGSATLSSMDEDARKALLLGTAVAMLNILATLADQVDADDLRSSFSDVASVYGDRAGEYGGVPIGLAEAV